MYLTTEAHATIQNCKHVAEAIGLSESTDEEDGGAAYGRFAQPV